ncbi:winged helix-turn-helix transcriptional regulator [Streptomyces sp. AK08-02]|uniref:winged helix-turn-helix transcriptional regulator n=1 Tax=Streptomyces sp. AK08-02 TaxID=3028654 RepID=UPI0029B974E7|nr:winged helix-turn-helix transcriptional regulator [Streptomyces sp. AK08-02]MDX3750122.1 winged helix-turn-helix transcriptional regulator [Streptomyces sp. AK08-02]
MAATGLSRTTLTDLSRVTESLKMLAPNWSVWVLMTLSAGHLRYSDVKAKLALLADGQLHPKLTKLVDAGLVERTEHGPRNVTYGLSSRGAALMPVLPALNTWADTHLEKPLAPDKSTGVLEPQSVAAAQNIEDAIALISPRHSTPLVWALRARGTAGAKALAAEVMPHYSLSRVYPPLRRVIDDGLVQVTGSGDFQLSASGQALAPVYQALSAWAAGRPLTDEATHPLWGHVPTPSQTRSGPYLTTQSRLSDPPASPAPAQAQALSWKTGDLFSHRIPARPLSVSPAGGQRR